MLLNILDTICEEYGNLIIFILNIFILILLCGAFLYVRNTKKRWSKLNDYLIDVTKTVDSVRYGDLTKKINKMGSEDSKNLTESLNRMIETLHDREIMIDEFQRDLIKQNRILERTLNSLSDGLLVVDEHDKILRVSNVASTWFENENKNIVGKTLHDFIVIPRKKPTQTLNNDEIIIPTQKDSSFTISTVKLNLEDMKERYLIIIKDTTAQKELETLKEDFVATLTHDLKVPIIAETNMIDLFLNENFGKISDKQKFALKNMQTSNKELLELVQTVLETYKLRDGKITLYKENILLKSFIIEIINEMSSLAQKTSNNIVFEPNRDIRVFADKIQLRRVIKNLIQNAISYGKPKTPINITIGEIPHFVTIKIKDKGAGIAKSDIDKIFNRYFSAAKKFKKIGTGLGIYLAQQISKAHDGDLTVESKEGEYTEFTIKLPVDYERNTLPY